MSSHAWWYVARASGMVAWLLLTASVMWGIWLSTRRRGSTPRPNWLLDLHRWLGALAVTFTAMHLLGLLLDGFVQFDIADLFIPFAAEWHPLAVAWGIIGFYALAAVQASSLMMKRLNRDTWHRIHLTSYVLFWIASIHGLSAGTDAGSRAFAIAAIIGMGTVAIATLRRLARSKLSQEQPLIRASQ